MDRRIVVPHGNTESPPATRKGTQKAPEETRTGNALAQTRQDLPATIPNTKGRTTQGITVQRTRSRRRTRRNRGPRLHTDIQVATARTAIDTNPVTAAITETKTTVHQIQLVHARRTRKLRGADPVIQRRSLFTADEIILPLNPYVITNIPLRTIRTAAAAARRNIRYRNRIVRIATGLGEILLPTRNRLPLSLLAVREVRKTIHHPRFTERSRNAIVLNRLAGKKSGQRLTLRVEQQRHQRNRRKTLASGDTVGSSTPRFLMFPVILVHGKQYVHMFASVWHEPM